MVTTRIFSGIQPSGDLHIGNYLGAVRHWVALQQPGAECFYCIVDLHAITVPQEPARLRARTREVLAILLAAGIDPSRSTLFAQSQVPRHTELAWLLNCITPYGWLGRMTQFKGKSAAQREQVTAGLFAYPVLMAADILLYRADQVPVGEDQQQHLELARDIAARFNRLHGETFTLPEPRVTPAGARIRGLDDPAKKMSKSAAGSGHAINLLDPPEVIRRKFQRATTDSLADARFDERRPGVFNLLAIYEAFTGESREAIEARFAGKGYGELKRAVADVTVEALRPLRERHATYAQDPAQLDAIARLGAEKALPIAEATVSAVKERMDVGLAAVNTDERVRRNRAV
ncbi:MAG: tryptophan--tRNA ligase [SAR202 cluster bacterium]|nr:tryptophan--tRNA ligase [SAR202 cluster bacterium]